MKRFLIALMCVAVVFCYVPTMAFADQDVPAVQEQSETFADSEETDQNAALSPQAGTEEVRGGLSLTAPAAAQDIYVSGSGSDESVTAARRSLTQRWQKPRRLCIKNRTQGKHSRSMLCLI